jgi:hypothetical protein
MTAPANTDLNTIDVSRPVRLSESSLGFLRARIDKLNGRCGGGAVRVETSPVEYTRVWMLASDLDVRPTLKLLSPEKLAQCRSRVTEIVATETWFDVTVTLNAPKVEGHTLLARLEHLSEGNVIYAAPGCGQLDPKYRTASPMCGHCMTSRRRNDTFVVREEATGKTKQIGRNCLADFLRDPVAAERILDYVAMIQDCLGAIRDAEEADEESHGSGRSRWFWKFEKVVALAAAYSQAKGWVSAAAARDQGVTSSAAAILDQSTRTKEFADWWAGVKTAANAMLDDPESESSRCVRWILEVLATKPDSEVSDYESNLVVLAKGGNVHSGQFALAASAIRAYYRHLGVVREAAERAKSTTGTHVGTVGERLEVPVAECTDIRAIGESDWGTRYLIKFKTPEGNELVWFTGESGSFEPEVGQTYAIKGTVKEHSEYRGRRNTVLSRVCEYAPKPPKVKKTRTRATKKGESDASAAEPSAPVPSGASGC